MICSSPTTDKFLKISDITRDCRLSKSFIYAAIAAGTFPRPAKIGRSSRWRLSDINRWMESQR